MWGMEQERSALAAALALQCDWGADEALMESPADRLAVRDAPARAPEAARPAPEPTQPRAVRASPVALATAPPAITRAEALAENDGHGPNGEPPRKRVVFEPLQLGPIANLVPFFTSFFSCRRL